MPSPAGRRQGVPKAAEDTEAPSGVGDRGGLAAAYESLREAVLGGNPEGRRLELSVLSARGLAAWMATWSALSPALSAGTPATDPSLRTPPASNPPPSCGASLPCLPRTDQIVSVIAQMALAHA